MDEPVLDGTAPADDALPSLDQAPARPGRLARFLPRRIRVPGLPGLPGRNRLRITSRRGKLLAFFLVAGFGSALTVGGVAVTAWTETADFCGKCHTMEPELKGHALSAHRELSCSECHVEPGVTGWIKAKINGTRQLFEVITGTFPTPIPPPQHDELPATTVTCQRCHDLNQLVDNGGPIKLVLGSRFRDDEKNTRESVALVMRPAGFRAGGTTKGLHWHIVSDVEFSSADPRYQTIDYVKVTDPDGTVSEFVARGKVTVDTNVRPDIDRLTSAEGEHRMDCLDCHNRVGHRTPSIGEAVDAALETGKIDPTLPFIKQQAMAVLGADYASGDAAGTAIEGLRDFYAAKYPLDAKAKAGAVNAAIGQVKVIYSLVATPAMKVGARTYPDNLGHQDYPGCFRCHDGGHYKVVDGAITTETIPSTCATCHTFPQIGDNTSAILIGERPSSHLERLWVFDHKTQVSAVDPAGTSCSECHTRTYCENCHNTPAVNVPHDNMVFDHASVARNVGTNACTLCHQPSYCTQCHAADQIYPSAPPGLLSFPSASP
jgi:nitrate/TMAO reductase-like tetraheme cytochrome c subunit